MRIWIQGTCGRTSAYLWKWEKKTTGRRAG